MKTTEGLKKKLFTVATIGSLILTNIPIFNIQYLLPEWMNSQKEEDYLPVRLDSKSQTTETIPSSLSSDSNGYGSWGPMSGLLLECRKDLKSQEMDLSTCEMEAQEP